MYLDVVWTCGGVAHSFRTAVKRLSEPTNCHQDCLVSSAQSFYGPCLRLVVHSLTWGYSATAPHVHPTSRYTIARDQFYQAFPHVSIASDKHWGEKAWVQGYEQWVFAIAMTLRNSVEEVATHSYNTSVLHHWLVFLSSHSHESSSLTAASHT